MTPHDDYALRLERSREIEAARRGVDQRVSRLRLAVFVGAIIGWAATTGAVAWAFAVAGLAAFSGLVVWHERTRRALEGARHDVTTLERALARTGGTWRGGGVTEELASARAALFAQDLDLFGPGSVFELLCTAEGAEGRARLASWLCEPSPDVAARQDAVREAAPDVDLRVDVARLARGSRTLRRPEALREWARAGARGPAPGRLRAAAWGSLVVGVGGVAAWLGGAGAWAMAPWGACLASAYAWGATTMTSAREVERAARQLRSLRGLLERVEATSFASGWWTRRLDGLRGQSTARSRIGELEALAARLDVMKNALFAPVGLVLMWPLHAAARVETWRREVGPHVAGWLDVLGDVEALLALAAYTYERPQDVFPTLEDGPPSLEAIGLGHPLLDDDVCVRNDVTLSTERPALLISGSNMAGKSTLLRAVGVNVVLAQAGAPVCARSMRLTRLLPAGTLRVQDSLEDGRSRFFAELERLKAILDAARGEPVLFLIDEILHGTNSRDRQIGAVAYAEALLDAGAIGMITTHDLTISDRARELGVRLEDAHLADRVVGDEWVFDYTLRPGPVETSNALAWLKAVGMDIV